MGFHPPVSLSKSLAEFAPEGAKKFESVFSGGMYGGKNTSRPAAASLSKKALPFLTVSQGDVLHPPAFFAPGGQKTGK